ALGHDENEVTVSANRGEVLPAQRTKVSGEPTEPYEVALIQPHERNEAARAGAPGNDSRGVSKQHAPTITHEPPAASTIRARIDAAGRALPLASFVRPVRVCALARQTMQQLAARRATCPIAAAAARCRSCS